MVRPKGYASLIETCLETLDDDATQSLIRERVLDHQEVPVEPFDEATTPDWLSEALSATGQPISKKALAWLNTNDPPPLRVGDHRLNDAQMAAMIQTLMSCPVEERCPLLVALRQHVDMKDCDAFAWSLFQSWSEAGSPSKEKWMMGAIGHLGGDACVLKLTPLIRQWPGESQHARAVFGLACLRAIGSNLALMQLSGIAQKLKFKGLKAKAQEFVQAIAEEKGLTRDELEDRVIPDCGLDERGRREFSFGPRSFSFVLGGDLKPMLKDDKGKLRPNLPKPNTKDDADLAVQAEADWKLIKKQIKEVAKLQAERLEQAVITGRRWSVDDFQAYLVNHPLMTHLVQPLVWAVYQDHSRGATFRVTEERDCADVRDEPLTLDERVETIGLVHPLELDESERAAWGQVLSDYELIPPFLQLGRPIHTLSDDEASQSELARYHGLKLVAPTLVFTLEKLGWIRGKALDGGGFFEHTKYFPSADVTAVVTYDGTVSMGYIDVDEILILETACFMRGRRAPSWDVGVEQRDRLTLGKVSPIVISEIIADLEVLQSKAQS